MSGNTLLQIFLYSQFLIIGALAAVAILHAKAHFKSAQSEPEPVKPLPANDYIPPATKERLLKESQAHFKEVLDHSAEQLQHDLGITTGHINNLVMRLATEIVSGELERYRNDLSQLHEQANGQMTGISKEVAKHEAEIKARIEKELEAEKQRLIKQIDTKLADAVGSFLLEALQHNVDLGSQTAYLIAMLEEHKADFIKEVSGEAQPAK